MTRESVIAAARDFLTGGGFEADLARRVAIPTESQELDRRPDLHRYLNDEIAPSLEQLGFTATVHPNPDDSDGPPFLVARRHESDDRPTVLGYGHGDVVRGYDEQWRDGLSPWRPLSLKCIFVCVYPLVWFTPVKQVHLYINS